MGFRPVLASACLELAAWNMARILSDFSCRFFAFSENFLPFGCISFDIKWQ
jgi:hypothetical protein